MAKDNLDVLIEESEKALEKGESLGDIEADHHGKEKLKGKSEKLKVEEKIEEEKEAGKEEKSKAKKKKIGKTKVRSKKYQEVKALVDAKEKYEIKEGIELVKKTSMTKFDGNVEVHIRILGKNGKPEQVRGLLQYPHSTGKKLNIVILDDKIIEEIEKIKKADADIYLTTPAMMAKVAKLAKILGPKGKMPNPKAGTITENPEKTMKDMSAGQVEYKTDKDGNLHQVIGKVSGKA
ncbi:MAG: hypothetical protein Q7K11_00380, partial [Candidatus Berkelbacteria bacterium]|nr:hypothetical protein [Candidatus Berkelbacteria bacterium]